MVKVLVIYDTKFGNTKHVAELIAEGIGELGGLKPTVSNFSEVKDLKDLANYDVILIGTPNHGNAPSKAINKFIDNLAKISLQGKKFAGFDTYTGGNFEKAVKKLEQKILEKLPGFHKIAPGLSVKVQSLKGPIIEEDIPKCKEFGQKISSLLK